MAGVAGNQRLTAMTGAILLAGFAVEGFTILGVHQMLFLHFLAVGIAIAALTAQLSAKWGGGSGLN